MLAKIKELLQKLKPVKQPQAEMTNSEPYDDKELITIKSWFEERYEMAVIQRNWLLLFSVIALTAVVASVIAVTDISLARKFDPFVIQIEDNTGLAKVVNPVASTMLGGDEALTRYFIKEYVTARETYNAATYHRAGQVVRLMSAPNIYSQYWGYIHNKVNDPELKYGVANSTYLTVKSWSKIDGKKFMLRFSVKEVANAMRTYNKLAILDVEYIAMSLNAAERDINPVGFQVKEYSVNDDNS